MIYVIIPVFNRWSFTKECLASLHRQTYNVFKIIVVDHGSSDGTSNFIKQCFPEVHVLKGENTMWWTAATNVGVEYAIRQNASYILTLNNDLVVDSNYIEVLKSTITTLPKCILGSVTVNIKNRNHIVFAGTKWHKLLAKYSPAVSLNLPYDEFSKKHELIECDLLPGRGTLIPTSVFDSIGLYNEKSFPHYMADEDFSDRAKSNGFKLYVNSKSVVYSHVDATGLGKTVNNKNKFYIFRQVLTSIKSPNNIHTRWNWAKKSKFPIFYFIVDFGRVFFSQTLKLLYG